MAPRNLHQRAETQGERTLMSYSERYLISALSAGTGNTILTPELAEQLLGVKEDEQAEEVE